ncbi:MAG: toprim domain-containing protein [Candidatus Bathyarchaeota archaeon]|nr:toprim domain-containing protein [Candidatus Bathyarchaeota archaeon]MDH5701166.1 toprim domain-containing protein [Candidatus Bathyarchaeota archaeon]
MSTKSEKKLEKILKLLERLATESTKGTPIIVEGRNDINALHKLGLEGDIISAKSSGKSFLDVLGEIEGKGKREVILLMDFDRHGKEWTNRLARRLEEMKITPNLLFWRELLGLVGHDVKDIEGLATYLETLRKKVGA